MHELAICQALVSQVAEIARNHQATRVRSVRIGIGPLAGIEPLLLAQAYPLAGAGTAAEGSRLEIEAISLRVRCRQCGADSAPAVNCLRCRACGDEQTELLSGDEMLLQSVELDVSDETIEAGDV